MITFKINFNEYPNPVSTVIATFLESLGVILFVAVSLSSVLNDYYYPGFIIRNQPTFSGIE